MNPRVITGPESVLPVSRRLPYRPHGLTATSRHRIIAIRAHLNTPESAELAYTGAGPSVAVAG